MLINLLRCYGHSWEDDEQCPRDVAELEHKPGALTGTQGLGKSDGKTEVMLEQREVMPKHFSLLIFLAAEEL